MLSRLLLAEPAADSELLAAVAAAAPAVGLEEPAADSELLAAVAAAASTVGLEEPAAVRALELAPP